MREYIDGLFVSEKSRSLTDALNVVPTGAEVEWAIKTLRISTGGGDDLAPALVKAACPSTVVMGYMVSATQRLFRLPHEQWQESGLDGPALQIPLWKGKPPWRDKDRWRGIVLLWLLSRVLARVLNRRLTAWFECSGLALPYGSGFRKGMGCDDAMFVARRLEEEV